MERILPPGGLGPNVGAGGGTTHILNARLLRAENDHLTRQLSEAEAELAALKSAMVKPLEWRPYGFHRQGLEASAFGLETAYRVDGKPGDWVLTSTGAREYIHTPGYETRAAAQAAAAVDHRRRVIAELARASLPVPPEEQEG